MSNSDLTTILFVLLLLVGLAQLLGYVFVKLRQPKVIGEILAGIVLGPALLGRFPAVSNLIETATHRGNTLDFVYWLGFYPSIFSLERGYHHPGRAGRTSVDIYPHASFRFAPVATVDDAESRVLVL